MNQPVFEQEIRFALVMYGGVSLAIYMNGVTQEFLHLVKSTAVDSNGKLLTGLTGTEETYRELASILRAGGKSGKPDDILRTRFIVDIATGSSAGGINAIFLGKALANNTSLDKLQNLWLMQAGFEDLLNDSKGADESKFMRGTPRSLLNSDSIYSKLVGAFAGMDGPDQPFPLQPEMDVFATATDLQGIELPIELADMQVVEKKHKEVFHLSFESGPNGQLESDHHFSSNMNSFLAFVARATSSFPVAFEPMRLYDMDRVLRGNPSWQSMYMSDDDKLKQFFFDYTSSTQDDGYRRRAFGDGGDLDNKPFSYAIDTLATRNTELPMQRKLVYIEPSPDKAESNETGDPPNFIQNALAATITLHQSETIREDLQRVLERNRLIDRVQKVTNQVDEDIRLWKKARDFKSRLKGEAYKKRTVSDEIKDRGPGYAGYYRLKVQSVTDELAAIVTRAAELLESSDEYAAIRYIVGYWRRQSFREESKKEEDTTSTFLLQYDLNYRQRRVRFLLRKLDDRLAANMGAELREIQALRMELSVIARGYRKLQREGEQRGRGNFTYKEVNAVTILSGGASFTINSQAGRLWLRNLPGIPENLRDSEIAKAIAPMTFEAVSKCIMNRYQADMIRLADQTVDLLKPDKPGLNAAAQSLRREFQQYFEEFEYYDQVIFPIFYETSVGEGEPASVIRISPEDATSVINEKKDSRRKLAGTSLYHFGAFFDRLWRSNDILWGRLDGAERIICSLLPKNSPDAPRLIRAAHLKIVNEHLRPQEQAELKQIIVRTILSMPRDSRDTEANLRAILESQLRQPVDSKVDAVFTACLTDPEIYDFLKNKFEVNREFQTARALDVLSRATQIIGKMFEDVADSSSGTVRGALSPPARWIARLGTVFWGLVQVAIPGGLGNRVFRHWLTILYLFEILLLVGSTLAISAPSQQFAVTALILTAGIHLLTIALGDLMHTKRWIFRLPLFVLAATVLGLSLLGGWTLKAEALRLNTFIQQHLPWYQPPEAAN